MKPTQPDRQGHFGAYGGMFVPETLMEPLNELTRVYKEARKDPEFKKELEYYLREYVGRPTPLYFAERLTRELGGAKIYLKREDLLHTGAHKINNCLGQILLAKRMGKTRIIAETGAGQHGVATATVAAMFGMECVVYMGKVDMERQALNVFRMESLGVHEHWNNAQDRLYSGNFEPGSGIQLIRSPQAPDLDRDGLPDAWELQCYGGITNANPFGLCSNGTDSVMAAYVSLLPSTLCAWFHITRTDRSSFCGIPRAWHPWCGGRCGRSSCCRQSRSRGRCG